MNREEYGRLAVFVLLLIIGALLLSFITSNRQAISEWIVQFGIFSVLIFIFIYAISQIFALPGAFFAFLGAGLFGVVQSTIYSFIGWTLGSVLAFMVGRFLLTGISRKAHKNKSFKKIDHYIKQQSIIVAFLVRFIPVFPYAALNYGLAVTSMRTRDFAIGTAFGLVLPVFTYTYIGLAVFHFSIQKLLIAAIIYSLFILITWWMKKKFN